MDTKIVRELAEMVSTMGLRSLEVEESGVKIKIEGARHDEAPARAEAAPPVRAESPAAVGSDGPSDDKGMDFNAIHTIVSPIVGVFYAAAAPEKPPFVTLGSKVKKGDVLCIVEAMKLMNEIVADRDGEVVDVCANNGDVVEFGQTLFKIF